MLGEAAASLDAVGTKSIDTGNDFLSHVGGATELELEHPLLECVLHLSEDELRGLLQGIVS